MKALLAMSIGLNLLLLACLLALLAAHSDSSSNPVALEPVGPPSVRATATPKSEPPSQTKPFSWSQLESPDYRIYIVNLRSIGCPEQTISDIIRADVHALFLSKRQQSAISGRGLNDPWSTIEETRLVARLLGESSQEPPPTRTERVEPAPVLPLVLQKVHASTLGLNDDQLATIEDLRAQFLTDIGGTNQNLSDPAYAARWQKVQSQNDDMLRGFIGVSAFMRYQLDAGD